MQKLPNAFSIFIASAILLFLAGITIFLTPVAHAAATVDLACTGTNSINYSPGITPNPQSVTVTEQGSLTSCLVSSDSTLPSGSYTSSGTGQVSCVFGSGISATATYHWKNNKTSTVTYTSNINVNPNGVTIITDTGIITAGEFKGDNIVQTDTFIPTTLPACTGASALTAITGTLQMTVTHG